MAKMPKRKPATPEYDYDEKQAFDDALKQILGAPSPRPTPSKQPKTKRSKRK